MLQNKPFFGWLQVLPSIGLNIVTHDDTLQQYIYIRQAPHIWQLIWNGKIIYNGYYRLIVYVQSGKHQILPNTFVVDRNPICMAFGNFYYWQSSMISKINPTRYLLLTHRWLSIVTFSLKVFYLIRFTRCFHLRCIHRDATLRKWSIWRDWTSPLSSYTCICRIFFFFNSLFLIFNLKQHFLEQRLLS